MRRTAGIVLVLAGLLLVAVPVGTVLHAERSTALAQERLRDRVPSVPGPPLEEPVAPDRAPVAVGVAGGEALAVLRIPRLGRSWSWVVLEGTSPDVLAQGPGHYRGTALPGARGNTALAGHRAGHGSPFLRFDELRPGDAVLLEQGDVQWVYRLTTAPRVVPVSATWVLRQRAAREVTLTTCWPTWGSSRRMFVRGELTEVRRTP